MHLPKRIYAIAFVAAITFSATTAEAQSKSDLNALQGLAPVSALDNDDAGKAALARNLTITGDIQHGTAHQPTLLPFSQQQQLALRDAFLTRGNAYDLADGLGSTLGGVYQSLTNYTSTDDGRICNFTNISQSIANLISFANATTRADSGLGKFFFANATVDGMHPATAADMTILKEINGTTDIFGKAYGLPAGSKGADRFGNSRPFQTETYLTPIAGKDFFGVPSNNTAYLRGPAQNLTD